MNRSASGSVANTYFTPSLSASSSASFSAYGSRLPSSPTPFSSGFGKATVGNVGSGSSCACTTRTGLSQQMAVHSVERAYNTVVYLSLIHI